MLIEIIITSIAVITPTTPHPTPITVMLTAATSTSMVGSFVGDAVRGGGGGAVTPTTPSRRRRKIRYLYQTEDDNRQYGRVVDICIRKSYCIALILVGIYVVLLTDWMIGCTYDVMRATYP